MALSLLHASPSSTVLAVLPRPGEVNPSRLHTLSLAFSNFALTFELHWPTPSFVIGKGEKTINAWKSFPLEVASL